MTYSDLPTFIILFALSALAYWHKDRVLLILAGSGFMIQGGLLWDDNFVLCLIIFLSGFIIFLKGVWRHQE